MSSVVLVDNFHLTGHTALVKNTFSNAKAGRNVALTASLAPGATGWLAVTFNVMAGCPQPLPVFFTVSFTQAGRPVPADLDSFPDLGQVRYNRCATAPAG